jgi:hypothetical protein
LAFHFLQDEKLSDDICRASEQVESFVFTEIEFVFMDSENTMTMLEFSETFVDPLLGLTEVIVGGFKFLPVCEGEVSISPSGLQLTKIINANV